MRNDDDSFSTRVECERAIARRNLAGKRKAQRVVTRWYIVDNPDDTLTISQFIQCAIVEAERQRLNLSVSAVASMASEIYKNALSKQRKVRSGILCEYGPDPRRVNK